ncbi:MAG: SpoIIE family protein phosphatase [Pirellulales bacterium]
MNNIPERQAEVASQADTAELNLGPDPRDKFYVASPVRARVDLGGVSHVGCVRMNNEDHFAVVRRSRTREVLLTNVAPDMLPATTEEAYAYVVADGLGGEVCGELASRLALTTAWEWGGRERSWPLMTDASSVDEIQQRMTTLVQIISETMQDWAARNPTLRGMATTFTAVYSVGRDAFVGHLGDSRAYLIRDRKIGQLTRDDTMAQFLLDAGARPQNIGRLRHVLTNCLSAGDRPATVTTIRVPLKAGDALLLCSDGLTEHVSDAELALTVAAGASAQETCEQLVKQALDRGGRDNVTVILARYQFD